MQWGGGHHESGVTWWQKEGEKPSMRTKRPLKVYLGVTEQSSVYLVEQSLFLPAITCPYETFLQNRFLKISRKWL